MCNDLSQNQDPVLQATLNQSISPKLCIGMTVTALVWLQTVKRVGAYSCRLRASTPVLSFTSSTLAHWHLRVPPKPPLKGPLAIWIFVGLGHLAQRSLGARHARKARPGQSNGPSLNLGVPVLDRAHYSAGIEATHYIIDRG
jgi:hypothetical protein